MVTRIATFVLTLVLAAAFSSLGLGQEKMGKETKKEGTMEMKKDMKEKGPVKVFSCDDECGFMMKSRDEKELTDAAMRHMKKHHGMAATEKEIAKMLKDEKSDPMKK